MRQIEPAAKVGVLLAIVLVVVVVWLMTRSGQAQAARPHGRKALPPADRIARLPADGGSEFNRLIHEKSPYLLQHARNPVDWFPWGPEALTKAKKENKPIFLSVGYSTCHWCHMMERESFERDDVAKILNEHFVAIKVDREERPDVDRIYILATQLTTGRGGWPNSVWLTPDGKPWFAGTYFPREDRYGRPGFKSVLNRLAGIWRTRRKEVDAAADNMAQAMKTYSSGGHVPPVGKLSRKLLVGAVKALGNSFDNRNAGFGGAPKFPPHGSLRLLMAEHARTKDAKTLEMATRTLSAMARGGIHDHLGGGFHRYSTDAKWLVPHFEKTLYDNAQLARAYVDAYRITGSDEYKRVAEGIFDWVLREMTDELGGFYSALDADSEGEEGKFYVWSHKEVLAVLGKADGELFCDVYGVTGGGNFRDPATGEKPGTNILHLSGSLDEVPARLAAARGKLLARRQRRVRPHRDDKVLVSWNALMIAGLARGGKRLKRPDYTAAAEKAADFILARMRKGGRLLRTYRHGSAKLNAYLDDYAFLADSLLELHEATGDKRRLAQAATLADIMLKHYGDRAGGGFFFTSDDHEDLLARTKDPLDRAIPSGNAVAAGVLVRLGRLTGKKEYLDAAKGALEAFGGFMQRMPGSTAGLLLATGAYLDGAPEAGSRPAGPAPDAVAAKARRSRWRFASRSTTAGTSTRTSLWIRT